MSEYQNAITRLKDGKIIITMNDAVIASVVVNSERSATQSIAVHFNDSVGKFIANAVTSKREVIRTISENNFDDLPMEVKVFCGATSNINMLEVKD